MLVDASSNIILDNPHVNVTGKNFKADPIDKWIGNTGGIDIYRSDHITVTNWVYEGGVDAVALKGNSTNIHVENITVYGCPRIAFGSLGQCPNQMDIMENVTVNNVRPSPMLHSSSVVLPNQC